jgi:RimJ/RimL family protein N-acetyltransferase
VVPVLETARLILRANAPGDLPEMAAMLADPEFVRFIGGKPLSREDAWRKLLANLGLWDFLGFGYWAVERKSDGAMIGQVGFADFKRDMQPSIEGLPEMGWVFACHAHGQGYAAEATAAAMAWADENMQGREIAAIIDPANAPSIRVAERLGFTKRSNATYRDDPILLFRRVAQS